VGSRLGYWNVQFQKGKIQDLRLDLEIFERYLQEKPVSNASDYLTAQDHADWLRENQPMIKNETVDVIVSSCVLNLVRTEDKGQLFQEMFRVLKRGGRCVISDIVSDEEIPERLKQDPELWSGCISGAFQETAFLEAFEDAGFHGMEFLTRATEPWAEIDGIQFRAVTVAAYKGKQGPCMDCNQAVIYKGPWQSVTDDDGHTLYRGVPMAVCEKTYKIYTREPYAETIVPVPPKNEIPLDEAIPFDCTRNQVRLPEETKGKGYSATVKPDPDACCGPDCC